MSNLVSLFCLVHGDSFNGVFIVKIERQEPVAALKELIIIKGPSSLKDMRAPDLKLWKWNKSSDEVEDSDLDDRKALDPRNTVNDVFNGSILLPGCTHIIIKTPEPGKCDSFPS